MVFLLCRRDGCFNSHLNILTGVYMNSAALTHLTPNIHIQILQTNLHTFLLRIS